MLRTLQLYISRQLLKTFMLSAFGLTLVFALTGGVFNMMKAELLSADQTLRLMSFVLPFALTLMLPVAALFSCAMVYGRLAADNEFDACRASGINIYRLLAPAFALSVVSFLFCCVSLNYILPKCVSNLEQLVQKNLQSIIVSALDMKGYFKIPSGSGLFYVYSGRPPRKQEDDDGAHIEMDSAALMRFSDDGERLLGTGTAQRIAVNLWHDQLTGDPIVDADMHDIRMYDFDQRQLFVSDEQLLDPRAVPMAAFTDQKTAWLNLSELLKFRQNPAGLGQVQRQVSKLRHQARLALFYSYVVQQLTTGDKVLRLGEFKGRPQYEIRAKQATNNPTDFRPEITDVTVKGAMEGGDWHWRADRCVINVTRGLGSPYLVAMRLGGHVNLTAASAPPKEKPDSDLDAVSFPAAILQQEAAISDVDLLGMDQRVKGLLRQGKPPSEPPPTKYYLGDRIEDIRMGILAEAAYQARQIAREIHSRLCFSASVLVLLIMAAALAIICRGGQLLTAFVISFLPGLVIVVLNVAGRQLSVMPAYHQLGLVTIWSGIVILAVADVVVLAKFLRR